MGEILLGDLEKVGYVVLECDYVIISYSNVQDYYNLLNNHKHLDTHHFWNKIHVTNRQRLYGVSNHLHENRFISDADNTNGILNIFQSDCDVINHHLSQKYNFNIF